MNEEKRLTRLILILVLAIIVVLGGTLAYWQWMTTTEQETLVNVSLTDDATILIDFPDNEITDMYPTTDCEVNGTSSWVTEITVNNGTGVLLSPNFKLKVKIEDKNGNVITNVTNPGNSKPNKYYVKYAVTEEDGVCTSPLFSGRFDQDTLTYSKVSSTDPHYDERNDWYDSGLITKTDEETGFPIVSSLPNSGVSFYAGANKQTTQKYKVWVWLSNEYVSTNVGTEASDTMQDAKITVSWSENSELEQIRLNTAYALYDQSTQTLTFHRLKSSNGALPEGAITGIENTEYSSSSEVPWRQPQNVWYDWSFTLPDGSVCEDYGGCYVEAIPEISRIEFVDTIYPQSTAYWFAYMDTEDIDLTKLDTSNTTNMSHMFDNFQGTSTGLDTYIENLDTSNVTDMSYMFNNYKGFDANNYHGHMNLSNWDTSNVTNMSHMFKEFQRDITGLENWNTSNVRDMSSMFESFSGYDNPYINVSNWNTQNVTNMSRMFSNSRADIESLENWNTSNVTNMESMFDGVWPDQYPDNGMNLSGWNVCKVTNYNYFGFDNWTDVDLNGKVLTEPYFNDPLRCNGGNPA